MKVPVRLPLRWDALVTFLSARTIDALESFDDGRYRRGSVMIHRDDDSLFVTGAINTDTLTRARYLFDADADWTPIAKVLRSDPLLRPLVARFRGTRVPGAWEPFEIAVRAIVGQQISVRGATTIMNRLAPVLTPRQLADAAIPGMPKSRAEAIRGLARAASEDETLLSRDLALDDFVTRMTALRGIGPWTAHYLAMRLGYRDAFPAADLGLEKAAAKLRIRNLEKRSERWRPFRAYAAMLLWESLSL